ncbi:MAG: helix-turn-helix domain-containing protein [Clostridiales bacterium]|nr:helix-turn-helix domain-containing protein [Clostridiales bacterium]
MRIRIEKLQELLKNFNILTHMTVTVFDERFQPVACYPDTHGPLCTAVRSTENGRLCCALNDAEAFRTCLETRQTHIYVCHAGLYEAVTPIIDGDSIIGLIMFGQVLPPDKTLDGICHEFLQSVDPLLRPELEALLSAACSSCASCAESKGTECEGTECEGTECEGTECEGTECEGTNVTYAQISAAAYFLELSARHLYTGQIVSNDTSEAVTAFRTYVSEHIGEELTLDAICSALLVSRSTLSGAVRQQLGVSVMDFIRTQRINRAKELLIRTQHPVTEIAAAVGINDYSYFSRIFKNRVGTTPSSYRNNAAAGFLKGRGRDY